MRSILVALLLLASASPALAQVYSELDLMADQVRVTENNFEFSPRLTVGFENEDIGTHLRYWHLNTTVNLGVAAPSYNDYRYHFDVLDWDVYKQYSGLRLFGGLRGGFLTFSALSSPASNEPFYVGNYGRATTTIPFFHYADDYNGNAILPPYYYPSYSNSSTQTDSIKSAIFGPTAGLEGDVPIIGPLWVDYGARCSFLLANWYSTNNYSSTYLSYSYLPYYPYYTTYPSTSTSNSTGRFADTLFVPEIYTGLELRWTYAQLGVKFEIQKWQSDHDNYSFQSPTIVGIGGTLSVRY